MIIYVLATVTGVLAALPLARLAARRSVLQPVTYDLAAETTVIGAVLRDPVLWAWVSALTPEHFAHPANRAAWAAIIGKVSHLPLPTELVDVEAGQLWIAELRRRDDIPTSDQLVPVARAAFDGVADTGTSDTVAFPDLASASPELGGLIAAHDSISAGLEDRTRFNGASSIVYGEAGEPLLLRRVVPVTRLRLFTVAALAVAALNVSVLAADRVSSSPLSFGLALAALVLLSASSLLWALVDYDTMYLDTPSFWSCTAAAWLLGIGAGFAEHDAHRVLAGVAVAVAGAIVFEGSNMFYRLVRGFDGMGGGDTLILLATGGIPSAITGSWVLGYQVVLGSMIAALLGWGALRVSGRITRETPFAFGPYLAVGWIFALGYWTVFF